MTVAAIAMALCLAAFIAFSLWTGKVYSNVGTFRRDDNPVGFWFAITACAVTMVILFVVGLIGL